MTRRNRVKRSVFTALVLGMALAATGCLGRSPSVRQFMLGTNSSPESLDAAPELAVLIGPVRLPTYLQRTQIARRLGGGEIEFDEFNRWLGGFEENLTTALARDVRERLGSDRVVAYPSRAPFPIDYSVRIHVDEWIVDESDVLRVSLRWAITASGPGAVPELAGYQRDFPLDGSSVEALVKAHDAAVFEIAQRLAEQLSAARQARLPSV